MSSLYDLGQNYEAVLNMIYDEDIDEQMILDTLEGIEGEIEDKAEYVVKIKWIYAEPDDKDAIKEPGFFGNQNSACKPTTPKWDFTVKRLKSIWHINE